MEVIVCPTCKTQHNFDIVSTSRACDTCKGIISGENPTKCVMCNDWDMDFHKKCATKIENMWYCNEHKIKKEKAIEIASIIQKYAQDFWSELGGEIVEYKQLYVQNTRRQFRVVFPALTLSVNMTPLTRSGPMDSEGSNEDLIALEYKAIGIKKWGEATKFEAGIHNHEVALKKAATAILRSLRSKKSALTVEKAELEDSHAKHLAELASEKGLKKQRKLEKHKETVKWFRKDMAVFNKQRNKIINMSNFMKKKLVELKKPKVEAV